jgi:DNA-binding ferritin-like protein (Dps family)
VVEGLIEDLKKIFFKTIRGEMTIGQSREAAIHAYKQSAYDEIEFYLFSFGPTDQVDGRKCVQEIKRQYEEFLVQRSEYWKDFKWKRLLESRTRLKNSLGS